MPTFNIDTAAAVSRLERVGIPAEQAREIGILPEADAEHVTKTDLHVLEQQLNTGFAKVEATIAQAHLRTVGIGLGGLAVATAILLTLG